MTKAPAAHSATIETASNASIWPSSDLECPKSFFIPHAPLCTS